MPLSTLRGEFVELFSSMSATSFIPLIVGLVLIVTEFFQPARKFLVSCGAALVVLGMAVRMLSGGTFVMLFYMVFGCASVILVAHAFMLATRKKGWLTQSLALKLRRSVSDEGYSDLLGRDGVATTDIDGSGHMTLDDVNFVVTSDGFIEKGCVVRVIGADGDSIKVAAVLEEE